MHPRAPSLDALHQFTLSQGVLEMVVSVAVGKGWPALYHVSESGSWHRSMEIFYENIVAKSPVKDETLEKL